MAEGAATPPTQSGELIDFATAVSTARTLLRPGPHATRGEIAAAVADLRADAVRALGLAAEASALTPGDSATSPVLVVDRRGWVQANADMFADLLKPLLERMAARHDVPQILGRVGSRVTGLELGALLAFLSSKVLGQFDPYRVNADGSIGRLLLVVPNIVAIERELRVPPSDFRLWVALHEQTHRLQFTAVPWLAGHLRAKLDLLLGSDDLDPMVVAGRLKDGIADAVQTLKGQQGDRPPSLIELLQTPGQRALLEDITGVMSLLEGHADVVVDLAGTGTIESLPLIRERFDHRRAVGASPPEALLRRLLGLDAKLRQYTEGAAFVRAVIAAVGIDGLNRVWSGPESLPSLSEITAPDTWLARVHGIAPPTGEPSEPEPPAEPDTS
jgi:coenzyme F420 biosynthesis associated uncharacterized protein